MVVAHRIGFLNTRPYRTSFFRRGYSIKAAKLPRLEQKMPHFKTTILV
jgi:hypothetical protein